MRISDWSSDVCSSDLIQDKPGGQCAELYPEKPIYDIPALPVVTGGELVERLLKQAEPFEPVFHLGQMAEKLERLDNGNWLLTTDLRSEEHTSELQSLMRISYAVFCLKKKTRTKMSDERQS